MLGKAERALEVALDNPVESERNDALTQIAVVSAENDESFQQSINSLTNDHSRAYALISISDTAGKSEKKEATINFLNEAFQTAESVEQPVARAAVFNEIAKRFFDGGEKEKAREIASQSLESIKRILDESHRAIALLHLAEVFEACGFELNKAEAQTVSTMIRKGEW